MITIYSTLSRPEENGERPPFSRLRRVSGMDFPEILCLVRTEVLYDGNFC